MSNQKSKCIIPNFVIIAAMAEIPATEYVWKHFFHERLRPQDKLLIISRFNSDHPGVRGARGSRITNHGLQGANAKSKIRNPKSKIQNGIALVAVLAILVVLAIMAASFTALMNIENKQSNVQMQSQQLDMLINSGLEQAKAIITVDEIKASREETVSDIANTFVKNSADNFQYSKWFTVKDQTGKIFGRYRLRLEDEAAKVNINKAFLLEKSKGTGWDTGEISLPNALGIPKKSAEKIIRYKYGKNNLPGGRGDDDQNNLILMSDGIDNNANGTIDEDDEGINDPREYTAEHLKGDDTKFSSMTEMMNILIGNKHISPKLRNGIMKEIPRRATIYSIDKSGSATLPNKIPSDINSITTRECRRLLIKANSISPFEPNSSKQMQLAANVIDYRDENHVLSTLGSTYGVEAICFNEILANDDSVTHDLVVARNATWQPKNWWRDNFGMVDDERCTYCVDTFFGCIPDSPTMLSKRFQVLDPRRAWHIKKKGNKTVGKLDSAGGGKWRITFPGAIGNQGMSIEETLYIEGVCSKNLPFDIPPGNKDYLKWPTKRQLDPVMNFKPQFSGNQYRNYCKEVLNVLKKVNINYKRYRPQMRNNYFRNSLVCIYGWQNTSNENPPALGLFKIISSDNNSITFDGKNYYGNNSKYDFKKKFNDAGMSNTYYDLSVSINSWANSRAYSFLPNANQTFLIRSRRPIAGNYYRIVFGRLPYKTGSEGQINGYPDRLGVSGVIGGDFSEDKNFEKRKWLYNDGTPIRTKRGGWLDLLVTSPPEISREKKIGQVLNYIRMEAPEVVEMYNASATPVSLANWRVICNTGTLATQIGRIRNTAYYDQKLRRRIIDNNPVVQPDGHFYLVNNTKLFDSWYGNADNEWGSKANEQVPVFQMDEENWGITYEIDKVKFNTTLGGVIITLKGLNFDAREVFKGETIKFVDKDNKDDPKSWNNVFTYVVADKDRTKTLTKNQFFTWLLGDINYLKNAKVMILGLPHAGGFVSLTLKNEYDQVCARTVDYGKVETDEINFTTEKIDPTKSEWIKRQKSSIGGTENKARNKVMQSHLSEKFFIKNGPYCSIAELGRVTTGGNFQRVADSGDISKGLNALSGLANVMGTSSIRLESCLGDVTRNGWKQAYDEVESSALRSITCKNGGWSENKWIGHTLRFLTGPLRGEKYPIVSNSKRTITLGERNSKYTPRSAPDRKLLKPNKEDKFSIGPGYVTPMCYTRRSGASAVWTWKNAIPYSGTYNFYIYGLNDAIDTTEFLEENNNASLDVELWNYADKTFEFLIKKAKYGKQDSFNAGKIKPENISDDGTVKMRLTAHNVVERNTEDKSGKTMVGSGGKQTGIAWFNYAIVTPVPVVGRVNINTATQRLLESLPGIGSELANNISEGIGQNEKKTLKPYQKLGDVLKVKGMTPKIFEKCANLFALDSSVFTIEVEAQIMEGRRSRRPKADDSHAEEIIAARKKRFIINYDTTENNNIKFKLLEIN